MQVRRIARYACGGFGLLAVVAAFLPWAEVRLEFLGIVNVSTSVGGTDGDGMITLVAGAAVAGVVVLHARTTGLRDETAGASVIICGLIVAGVGAYAAMDVEGIADSVTVVGADVSAGIGLILTIAAGVGIVLTALPGFVLRPKAAQSGDNQAAGAAE